MAPAIAACALIAGAWFVTPAAASAAMGTDSATPTPSATSTPAVAAGAAAGVSLALSPAGSGTIGAGADLTVTVEITNGGRDALTDGTLELSLGRSPITSTADYDAWLASALPGATTTGSAPAVTAVASIATMPLPPGATHTIPVTIPAAQVQLGGWGVYAIQAGYSVGGASEATGHSTIVWSDSSSTSPAPAGVTVIAPITAAASSTGLIPKADLESATAADGTLTRQLDAVAGRPVTIAVDPRIIVSIRALGSTAPTSAVSWLARLDAAPNPVIPLSYGDSDISAEHQAGASALLQPTSFSYALDPANFTNVSPLIEPTATATSGASATPTPTTAPPAAPTLEQLTSWDYTTTSLAWPRSGTVVSGDLPFFAQGGLTTTILDSRQLSPADGAGAALAATAKAGDQSVLVADHDVSTAMQDALAATTDTRRGQAVAQLSSALALAAGAAGAGTGSDTSGAGSQVLAVLDRTSTDLSGLDQVLATVEALPWSAPRPLQALLATAPTQAVTVIDAAEPGDRLGQIGVLLGQSQSIASFSSVLSDPSLLTGRDRADLLAVLSNAWTTDVPGWNKAVQNSISASTKTLTSVQIVEGSSINMVANQANLPVTVSNDLNLPVNVVVHVTPSNGRLVVEQSDVAVTIEASSRKGVQIPLAAGVANGPVVLSFQLLSPAGVLLSTPAPVMVNVSADWETWGTVIVAVLVVALFGFGIVRNILRRRKRPATDSAADAPAGSHE